MRILIFVLCLGLGAPALADSHDGAEGRDLMGEAMRLFLQGLLQEMEPALDDLNELLGQIDSYHPPEMLPNGDIIIRRKTPIDAEPGEEIEL